MILVIHCTRQQVTIISTVVGKLHIEQDGTKTITVPHWIEVMWKYAKVHEFREAVSQSRMITHPYDKDQKRAFHKSIYS